MSAVDTIRAALFGNPPVPTFKPTREGVLAAFIELNTIINGVNSGIRQYNTLATLTADTGQVVGTQARVYADSTSANNRVYYWSGSAWVFDSGYYNGLAQVVQPLVDLSRDWAAKASGTVDNANYPGLLSALQYAAQAAVSAAASSASALSADWKTVIKSDVIDQRQGAVWVDDNNNIIWGFSAGDKTPAELFVLANNANGKLIDDPISGEPTFTIADSANNRIARIVGDKFETAGTIKSDAAIALAIGSARAGRLNGTAYAKPTITSLIHLLKFGQSNSVNVGDALGLPIYAPPALMFNGGIHTRRGGGAAGATGAQRTSLVPMRETGSETGMGPAIEMMLQLLRDEDGFEFTNNLLTGSLGLLGSSAGVGGINIQTLRSTYWYGVTEDIASGKALADGVLATYSLAGFLYNGNESNQASTPPTFAGSGVPTTVVNFRNLLRQMQLDVTAAAQAVSGQTWAVPMFLVQTNTHFSNASANYNNPNAYVGRAQLAAGVNADNVNPDIIFCGPSYQYPLAGVGVPSADEVHFTSVGGAVRDAIMGIYMKRIFFDGIKPPCLVPAITRFGKTLRLKFPMMSDSHSLMIDTTTVPIQTAFGFRVFNGAIGVGTQETINVIRVISKDTVEIGCANTPAAGWEVDYAIQGGSGSSRGQGNLRDNQGDKIIYAPSRFNWPMHNWVPLFREIVA